MTKTRPIVLALTACLVLSGAALAQGGPLLAPATGDLAPRHVVSQAPPTAPGTERAPVQFAWALEADAPAITAPAGFTAVSREHWRYVDGAELARGLSIETTAPGALLLISPDTASTTAVGPQDVRVLRAGRALPAEASIRALAPQAALEDATGARFAPGALGFRLAPELGTGRFDVQVAGAQGRYVVHVREPDSPYALRVDSPVSTYATGTRARLSASLEGEAGLTLRDAGGMLLAPDGREFPLQVTRTRNGAGLEVALPAQASSVPGLWEAHVLAVADAGGTEVLRDAKVAFEVAAPTARLAGRHAVRTDADGALHVDLPVEVGAEGRYEVRAVLYGTGSDGRLLPVAVAHSADWLGPGTAASLPLTFPAAVLGGARAPFELRQLALHDQGRMGRLEYRERGARIAPTLRSAR